MPELLRQHHEHRGPADRGGPLRPATRRGAEHRSSSSLPTTANTPGRMAIMSGKILTCYEEAFHVPLIVVDPTGRFAGDIDTVRTGLTSSVDMLPFLVSLGHNGSRDWMTGDLAAIYGKRHDMVPMLRSAASAGPALSSSRDRRARPGEASLTMRAPCISPAIRTHRPSWRPIRPGTHGPGQIEPENDGAGVLRLQHPGGHAELTNTPQDPRAQQMANPLLNDSSLTNFGHPCPGGMAPPRPFPRPLGCCSTG